MKNLSNPTYKILFIIILILCLLVPFIDKAFHIDDTMMLYCARDMQKNPFYLSDATVYWLDGIRQSLRFQNDSPLISYYTSLIIKAKGESEVVLHLFFLVFPVMAIISMYSLSKHFTLHPLISALLLASTPAFMVSSTNIMPDIAMFSFYLAAISTFIYGIDRENNFLLITSCLLAGLASLTKYIGFTLIPLFLLYAFLKRKLFKGLWALCISFILPAMWSLGDFLFFKRIQIIDGLQEWQYFKPAFFTFGSNLLGLLTYIGSVTIFPLLFLFLIRKKKHLFSLIIWMTTILFIGRILKFRYTLSQGLLSVFFIALSIFVCQRFIESLKRKKLSNHTDTIFLLTWLGMIFCYNVFIQTWLTAARYTLLLTPPIILLLMKKYEALFSRVGNIFYKLIYIGIALNFLLSVLLNFADYSFANAQRNFTKTYAKYLKEKNAKVWFRGHWGFQYYMEKEGFTYLGIEDIPKKDDIIIMAINCDYEEFSPGLKDKVKFIGSVKYATPYFLRTISPLDKINFYSYTMYGIGTFPYGISDKPLGYFKIWQVE